MLFKIVKNKKLRMEIESWGPREGGILLLEDFYIGFKTIDWIS